MAEDPEVLQLWRACYSGNLELVEQLIEEDEVDFCQRDRNGETVVHMAARSDNSDVLNFLLDHLSPDVQNQNHQTPLHLAAIKGHLGVINVLLQADCQLNNKTKYSEMTALHLACQHNRPQVVAALLDGGAVCNMADTIGKPPGFYTTDQSIQKLFTEHAQHCTHNDNNPDHTSDTDDEDEEEDNSDEMRGKKTRKKNDQKASSRAKYRWDKATRATKKVKINHGLGFSEEHKRRMEMNVFDRLMGNKKK